MDVQKKIMIVDDDPTISEMYSIELRNHDYVVEQAFDAKEAVHRLESGFVPDLILLDIIMPGDNGLELLEKLLSRSDLVQTKIIIFSNLDQKADMDDKFRAKITTYLLKVDMTPIKLRHKVDELLAA